MAQTLGSVAVGSIVKLNEGGSPVEFYVAKHDYESGLNGVGRTLVVRKDCYDDRVWDSGNVNAYASSDLDSWFNSTYKNMLDADIRSLIGTTKIRYTPGNGNWTVGTLERAVFLLSAYELGKSESWFNKEGTTLPNATNYQIAKLNGSTVVQWTRSPVTYNTLSAVFLNTNGSVDNGHCTSTHGSRPAFTLPSNLYVSDDGTIGYPIPTLSVPQMVMQGQSATISWSAIEGADSYTLQRKADTDADWTQVYSGADLSYTETVGTWTSLQYRVQAVFDGTPGGWATSDPIQIVSASALVISGQDGDLGTLVNDVPYSISSDQTSPTIDVTVEVNGGEYASFQATSGQTYKVGVLDLPTGTGSIVITASTTVSESPVTVTRTWTYSKTAQTFPNSGSVATLTKDGNVVYPETLIEAVRASMTPWGGNLSTALNLLKNAALFNRTSQPKYSEVTVSLSGKTEGQTIQLPENGRMVEFYVAKLDYESALNGAGRVLLVRKDCYDERAWDAVNVNTWASSDLLTWLNGTYKGLFPEEVQTAMGTTTYYYTPGNGNNTVTTRSDAVFSLSATELGLSQTWFNVEGSALPIVNTLKIAYLNGNANTQWTRTPNTSAVTHAIFLNPKGSVSNGACNYSAGARPCFTLPSTFSGTYYVDQGGTIHESQEYTESGDWLDVWGNAIPAVKIETGSYVGTGTYGLNNLNTLTFSFEPKFLVVMPAGGEDLFRLIAINGAPVANTGYNNTAASVYVSWEENSVSWYSSSSAPSQLNTSTLPYTYLAIG